MLRLFFIAVLGSLTIQTFGQFQEYSSVLGAEVTNPLMDEGNGVSFVDFNLDGWDDLSVVRKELPPMFFLNTNGTFEPVDLNITNEPAVNQKGITWADYDNDGDRDLLITQKFHPIKLYRNDGDLYSMTEVTVEAGLAQESVWNSGASWVDYDRDGFLDLYICKFYTAVESPNFALNNHLYRNLGDGTFENVTLMAGVGDDFRPSFQSVFLDYNNDCWPDLYVVNDRMQIPNSLYMNNGDGTFSNVSATSGTNVYIDAMCGAVTDYDHDGDLDIFVSNTGPDVLLLNNGNGTFSNYAAIAGVNSSDHGWGGLWIDHTNDTWQDLFVCNQETEPNNSLLQNNFYLNEGDGSFIHFEDEAGLGNDDDASFSIVRADFDKDGWEDFFTHNGDESPSSLWKNQSWQSSNNHWLQITLQGVLSNRDAVGSWIQVYLADDLLVRFTTSGDNYLSQNSFTQHFGLGSYEQVDSVVIKWPSGITETYENVMADQEIELIEGASYSATLNNVTNDTLCAGDSVLLYISGFEEVLWSNSEIADSIYADTTGWYFANAITEEGLELASDSVFLTFTPPLSINSTVTDVLCYNDSTGTATFEITGGTPDYMIDLIQDEDLNHLPAGTYNVLCTDQLGCVGQLEFEIVQPDSLQVTYQDIALIDLDGCGFYHEGEALPGGGTPPFNFQWEFTGSGPDFPIYFEESTYTCVPNQNDVAFNLLVTDANGCTTILSDSLELFVSIEEALVSAPLVFPNPFNTMLKIEGMEVQELQLFDQLGELCFSQKMIPGRSQTTLMLPELSRGIYTCIIKTNDSQIVYRLLHF